MLIVSCANPTIEGVALEVTLGPFVESKARLLQGRVSVELIIDRPLRRPDRHSPTAAEKRIHVIKAIVSLDLHQYAVPGIGFRHP